MSVYHLKPWEIAQLTDHQIVTLYHHPREDDGSIKPVETIESREPRTMIQEMLMFECLGKNLRMKPEDIEAGKEKVRMKWAAKEEGGEENPG